MGLTRSDSNEYLKFNYYLGIMLQNAGDYQYQAVETTRLFQQLLRGHHAC